MMKLLNYFFLFICILPHFASSNELENFYKPYWKLTDKSIEYVKKQKIVVESTVDSTDKNQSFKLNVAAMHKESCTKVLRKLSLYENYSEMISFIKTSTYDDKQHLLTIKADHALLPYPMLVHIIVDRATKPGIYPFTFPTGIFTGLKGKFIIKKIGNQCAFYAESDWKGKKTNIPDFVIELFSETLTKLGGEILFRKLR